MNNIMNRLRRIANPSKQIANLAIAFAAVIFIMAGCIKDVLYNTPHPTKGKIVVNADWSGKGEGVSIPATWNISVADYEGEERAEVHAPDHLFEPGDYNMVIYTPAENITVQQTQATVAQATPATAWAGTSDPFISTSLGAFFTNVQDVTLEVDKVHDITAEMVQQVRQITLTINPTGDAADRVASIGAYLSGIAGALDFATGTYSESSNIELVFQKATNGSWSASAWVLGVFGAEQKLTGFLTFADDNPKQTPLESDMTAEFADFNTDKSVPFTLSSSADTPTESGVGATIKDWQTVEGEDISVK